jgi:hypothetical protein
LKVIGVTVIWEIRFSIESNQRSISLVMYIKEVRGKSLSCIFPYIWIHSHHNSSS